jgi:hypothetical protein
MMLGAALVYAPAILLLVIVLWRDFEHHGRG